jgi:AraC-like DNA-binding protein
VRTLSVAWAAAYTWRDRVSEWGQLLFASRGMLTVHTDAGLWVVPGGVAKRSLYLHTAVRSRLPDACRVVEISPLLREVLRRAMRLRTLDRRIAEERHLMDVLLDEVTVLPLTPLDLPMPRDARAVRAAAWMRTEPAARQTLAEVSRAAAASARTLERLFRSETGLPFGVWRQRARFLLALQRLAEGGSVAEVASAVGYESTSAFVAAFRRALGTTPGRYFKRVATAEEEDGVPARTDQPGSLARNRSSARLKRAGVSA